MMLGKCECVGCMQMMLRQAVDGYLNFKAGAVLLERSACKVNQNAAL